MAYLESMSVNKLGVIDTVVWFKSTPATKFTLPFLSMDHGILAQKSSQHGEDRGDEPLRKRVLLKAETKRRRLGIPMFLGKVT